MNSGPGNIEAHEAPAVSPDQVNPPSRQSDLDHQIEEILIAVREQSERLMSIERRFAGEAPGAAIAPETKELWESTVRRFTGSIDVRLDILEDELGGLQDELTRLQEVARERVDAAQRRLTWRYAIGQAVLAILIVVLLLTVRAGEGTNLPPRSSPEGLADTPTASGLNSAAAGKAQERVPPSDAMVGVGADGALPALPDPESDETPMDAARSPVPLQIDPASDSVPNNDQPEPVAAQGSSLSGPEQVSVAVGAPSPPKVSTADEKRSPAANYTPIAVAASEHAPSTAVQTKQQSIGSGEARATAQAPANGTDGVRASGASAASAADPASNSDPKAAGIVLDRERFAIQLIGFRSESSILPFVEKFGIADIARYIHSRNQDRDWYLVLLGDYATKEQGKAAMNAMRPELRKLEPWIRPLPAGTRMIPAAASADAASDE